MEKKITQQKSGNKHSGGNCKVREAADNNGTIAVFPLSGKKRACQFVPGPVAFSLSLSGHDRASLVFSRGQLPGFFGARGVVMNNWG